MRPKRIRILSVEPLPQKPAYFQLRMRTQAGTYIKEFVHGDLGRSTPSMCSLLGMEVQILQLDVLEVHLENWP